MANWMKVPPVTACKRACKLLGVKGISGQLFATIQVSVNKSTGTCMFEGKTLTRNKANFYMKVLEQAAAKGHEAGWKKNHLGIWFKYAPASNS